MLTVVLLLFCTLFSNIYSQINPLRFDHAIDRIRQFRDFSFVNLIENVEYNFTLEHMLNVISNNQTTQCEQDFDLILHAASQKDMWAIKVLDAWGKPLPSGIMKGNVYWVGDYNECLELFYNPANKSFISQPFHTQYCTLRPNKAQSNQNAMSGLVLGLCVPSSCNRQDVASLVHSYFKKDNISEDNLVCSNDPPNGQQGLTNGAIATIVILSILGLVVLIGTIIDLILTSKIDLMDNMTSHVNGHNFLSDAETTESGSEKFHQYPRYSIQALIGPTAQTVFLAEFSAIKSLRRIFTMKQKKDDDSFLFINGIRVLSLIWVIIGHSLLFGIWYSNNVLDILVWSHNIFFQLFINAVLSVDTFFVLSGFLTAVLFVRQVKKEDKLSFRMMILYYIHRYIRLTPTFLLMILVSINLTPYFGHGPVYPSQQGFEVPQCRSTYWWTSILYVGNIVKPDYMCLGIAWYLHNDMQFHWIAPLALIPFALGRRSLSFFITIFFVFIGIGSILTILLYYPDMSLNDLDAFAAKPGPDFYKNIYITPWCRISAYAVGMLTGYIVIDTGRHYRMQNYIKLFGSIFMFLIALACLFTTYPDYIHVPGLSRTVLVIYQSFSRTFWSIVIGWILFLCSTNQGGIVNKILSWPIWSPLARLNYSCYLVHATIINISLLGQVLPIYFQGHIVINNFISHIFFSYVAAIVVNIFFETPFFVIEKKILKR